MSLKIGTFFIYSAVPPQPLCPYFWENFHFIVHFHLTRRLFKSTAFGLINQLFHLKSDNFYIFCGTSFLLSHLTWQAGSTVLCGISTGGLWGSLSYAYEEVERCH